MCHDGDDKDWEARTSKSLAHTPKHQCLTAFSYNQYRRNTELSFQQNSSFPSCLRAIELYQTFIYKSDYQSWAHQCTGPLATRYDVFQGSIPYMQSV